MGHLSLRSFIVFLVRVHVGIVSGFLFRVKYKPFFEMMENSSHPPLLFIKLTQNIVAVILIYNSVSFISALEYY